MNASNLIYKHMETTKTIEKQKQAPDDYRPLCPVHNIPMEMLTYSWGEVDFVCPKGHVE